MTEIWSRRTLVAGMACGAGLAALPAATKAQDRKAAGVAFAVLGDWGRDTPAQHAVARAMGDAMADAQGRFVLTVGDNFYQAGVQSVDDPLWKTCFEDVYTHPALQGPWHVTLGNHDYYGKPQAQVDYSATSRRWQLPARYYKVEDAGLTAMDIDMFVIDTAPFIESYRRDPTTPKGRETSTQDTDAQVAWLDRELGRSQARMTLVVGHHTIHSGGSQHGDTAEMIARIKPVLLRHRVTAYIAGHDHDLQHIMRDGLTMIQCGGGMEARPVKPVEGTRFCIAEPGFAMITATAAGLDLRFRDQRGHSLYQATIPARTRVLAA